MHRFMSILVLLSMFFTFGSSGRTAPAADGNPAEAAAAGRLVVFEGFYRPT